MRGIRSRRRICSTSFSAAKRCRRSRRATARAFPTSSRSTVCRAPRASRPGQKLILPAGVSKNTTEPVVDQGIYPDAGGAGVKTGRCRGEERVGPRHRKLRKSIVPPSRSADQLAASRAASRALAVNIPSAVAEVAADDAAQKRAIRSACRYARTAGRRRTGSGHGCRPSAAAQAAKWWRSSSSNCSPIRATIRSRTTARSVCRKTRRSVTTPTGSACARATCGVMNGMRGTSAVRVGKRLKLDFSKVDAGTVRERARCVSPGLQEQFFANHRIVATSEHVVKPGESIWVLAERRYNVPVWLLRQYNPDLDLALVRAVHPSRHSGSGEPRSVTAEASRAGTRAGPRARLWRRAVARGNALLPHRVALIGESSTAVSIRLSALERHRRRDFSLRSGGTTVAGDRRHIAYRSGAALARRSRLGRDRRADGSARAQRRRHLPDRSRFARIAAFWSLIPARRVVIANSTSRTPTPR